MARSRRGQGTIYQMKGSPFFWCAYSVNGVRVQKNTKKTKRTEANAFLKDELLRASQGYDVTAANLRVKDLYPLHVRAWQQELKSPKSLDWQRYTWENHLLPFFGEMKAADVTTPVLQRYIEKRFADVDATDTAAVLRRNGSINRELAVLSSAFSMAYDMQPRLVPSKLHFKRLTESPARKGFIDESGYQRLIRACPHVWMKALLCIGFRTGMRRGEVLALNVEDVDMRAGTIRIRKSKNGEPRTVPFIFDMKQHIVPMLEGKKPTDKVFTRTRPATHQNPNGRIVPVANFQSEWGKATEQAGLNITFHDLRRSAVRAMSLAGLDQVEAMRISGHKTNSMFVRYNIVDESRLRDAAAKIDAFAAIERKRAEAESQARVSARVDAESTDAKTPEVLQ